MSYRVGSNHHNAKLTERDVQFIRDSYNPSSEYFNGTALALQYGVSRANIHSIIHGRAWKHAGGRIHGRYRGVGECQA